MALARSMASGFIAAFLAYGPTGTDLRVACCFATAAHVHALARFYLALWSCKREIWLGRYAAFVFLCISAAENKQPCLTCV
ncbi:hypothetical protein BX070DRAFT_226438 [Coemansia spiralis]|nr:hypothetical protein BX070DRAFT_226438 [Coemansia spiralis]